MAATHPSGQTGPPSARDMRRHLADAVLPNVAFLVGYETVSALTGVVAALAAALVLVGVRLLRRNTLTAVVAGFGLVVLHTAMVVLTGEGRDYFLPWLIFNGVLTLACTVSLVIGRPITARLSRFAGMTPDPSRHRLVTALVTALGVAHLAVGLPLYLADMVVALGVAKFLLGPPAILVLGILTWRLLHQAPADEAEVAP
jgi:Kef-type K+ transport system membrane component KefB